MFKTTKASLVVLRLKTNKSCFEGKKKGHPKRTTDVKKKVDKRIMTVLPQIMKIRHNHQIQKGLFSSKLCLVEEKKTLPYFQSEKNA